MTTPTIPAADVGQVFDIELEQHEDDGKTCRCDDNAATHVSRHGACFGYVCTECAEDNIALRNIAIELRMSPPCWACQSEAVDPRTVEVTPL